MKIQISDHKIWIDAKKEWMTLSLNSFNRVDDTYIELV